MYGREVLGAPMAWNSIGLLGKGGAAASTLLDGLVSYWPLDEASGTRYDAVGTNDLTDNNTVGSAVGVSNAAASFVAANIESLAKADFIAPAEYTVSMWVNGGQVSHSYLTAVNAWASAVQFAIYVGETNIVYHLVGDQASGYSFSQAYIGGLGPVLDTYGWYHICAWMGSDQIPHVVLNNGVEYLTGAALPSLYRTPAELRIGQSWTGSLTGLVDEVAIWSRVLTTDERTELYNAGAGLFYPFG